MKIFYVGLVSVLLICSLLSCSKPPEEQLIGSWEPPGMKSIKMSFMADNTVTYIISMNSISGTYAVDFNITPAQLEVKLEKNQGPIVAGDLKYIIELIDENNIRLEEVSNFKTGSNSFTNKSGVFTRVREND